jgi:hypothetical protein
MMLDTNLSIFTDQNSITMITNLGTPNETQRRANTNLIDPYAMQYVFTFNQVAKFDSYPYPYIYSNYHDLLYRNSLYLFYLYVCGMDIVENEYEFLPQMDLNYKFLSMSNCQTMFLNEQDAYIVPSLIGSGVALFIITFVIIFCLWWNNAFRANCVAFYNGII